MIGVVIAGPASGRRVLGLAIVDRAVLALQAAGAERVLLLGIAADRTRNRLVRDDRVRVPIEVASGWQAGDVVVVDDGVVVDTRAVRTIANATDVAAADEHGTMVARGAIAGDDIQAFARGFAAAPADGVIRRVTDDATRRTATRALLDSLRKSQDGWISRLLNRRISLTITRGLVWLPIRPNALTGGILALGLAGAWLASRGDWASLAWGGVLFQLQSILDGCDGELSRLTFRGSKVGEWLDTIGDDVTNYTYFGGAAWGLQRAGLGVSPLVVGAIGLGAGVLASGIEYAYLAKIGSGDLLKYPLGFGADPEPTAAAGPAAKVLGVLRPAFKRDFFVFAAMLAAIAGHIATMIMLVLFAGGAIGTLSAVLASEWRRRPRPAA